MTSNFKDVNSIKEFCFENIDYVLTSGDGSFVDIFDISKIKESEFTSKNFKVFLIFQLLYLSLIFFCFTLKLDPFKSIKLQTIDSDFYLKISNNLLFCGKYSKLVESR